MHTPQAAIAKQLESANKAKRSKWYKDREASMRRTKKEFLPHKPYLLVLLCKVTALKKKDTVATFQYPYGFFEFLEHICFGLFFVFSLWNDDLNCVVCLFVSFFHSS